MFTCECGKQFDKNSKLKLHKPHCRGLLKCINPNCNNILTSSTQKKYCSTKCATCHSFKIKKRNHSIETRKKNK